VYWLQRPPILRYVAAGVVLLFAAWVEVRPDRSVDHPFAATEIPAGALIDESLIDWRPIPVGALPPIVVQGVATIAIPAGTPLIAPLLGSQERDAPDGWWTMELEFSPDLQRGAALQLVVIPGPGEVPIAPIPAVVVVPAGATSFSGASPGLVAVPPQDAAAAAIAAAAGKIAVLAGG
jgi:hypothetical protein